MATVSPRDGLVHSYLYLRRAIGVLGVALPVLLIVGNLVADDGMRDSISGYYYSDVRDLLVGTMCAVGVFLLSYRGYDSADDIAGNIAAAGAVGLAVFPTAPDNPIGGDTVIGVLHAVFAVVFFLTLAYFSAVLFRRSDDPNPTPRKVARNHVYLVCGIVIVVCLALVGVCGFLFESQMAAARPVLWLEALAIFAFGFSWLTKGEAILGDLGPALAPRGVVAGESVAG
ncbi:DUF998 domain-containing protein [Actinokineospora auranticolor]|uniref:DUF998 domain-containing protein n=1 Tax=Actinokineospora auranticolor TaxID=155976 RepID=A0A2S6GMQ9_9PSEU|nr:DUF998 domain-containing protein [Actinokineospora auranticolor]PPK66515.1 hypothetical protein CLV40_110219 [Actinokineospora auranticolor]